eukprot:GCRY01002508.1.p1 GENE.GCRY01002508.1~~GCRY01002508.1.p1  ORF type:complete len:662 (+),score=162.03 GCRY01002508.1:143-2128(+)
MKSRSQKKLGFVILPFKEIALIACISLAIVAAASFVNAVASPGGQTSSKTEATYTSKHLNAVDLVRKKPQSKYVDTFKTDRDDFGEEDYFVYLFTNYLAPALVVAVLSLLIGCCFICGRVICRMNCCGAGSPKKNYSNKERNVYRILMVVVCLAIAVCVNIGWGSNEDVTTGTTDFMDAFIKGVNETVGAINTVYSVMSSTMYELDSTKNNLVSFRFDNSIVSDVGSVVDDLVKVQDDVMDYRNTILDDFDSIRKDVIYAIYSFCLIFAALYGVAAILRIGKLSLCTALLQFLPMFLIFLLYALHSVSTVFLADVCVQVDIFVYGSDTSSDSAAEFLEQNCVSVESLADTVATANDQIAQTRDDIQANNAFADQLNAQIDRLQASVDAIEELTSCSIVKEALVAAEETLCNDVIDAFVFLYVTQLVIGILFFVTLFLGVRGVKRFPTRPKEELKDTIPMSTVSATDNFAPPPPGYPQNSGPDGNYNAAAAGGASMAVTSAPSDDPYAQNQPQPQAQPPASYSPYAPPPSNYDNTTYGNTTSPGYGNEMATAPPPMAPAYTSSYDSGEMGAAKSPGKFEDPPAASPAYSPYDNAQSAVSPATAPPPPGSEGPYSSEEIGYAPPPPSISGSAVPPSTNEKAMYDDIASPAYSSSGGGAGQSTL